MQSIAPSELEKSVGKQLGVSRWFLVDQDRIDAFADITEDPQFIHVDPVKSQSTTFGGTIAHGYLTLSMLSAMFEDSVPPIEGLAHSVNYGFNRIRFLSPVHAGKRIRGRFELAEFTQEDGQITQTVNVTIEIEGNSKPALVAEWISRHYFS